jgi:hypothetical protein
MPSVGGRGCRKAAGRADDGGHLVAERCRRDRHVEAAELTSRSRIRSGADQGLHHACSCNEVINK